MLKKIDATIGDNEYTIQQMGAFYAAKAQAKILKSLSLAQILAAFSTLQTIETKDKTAEQLSKEYTENLSRPFQALLESSDVDSLFEALAVLLHDNDFVCVKRTEKVLGHPIVARVDIYSIEKITDLYLLAFHVVKLNYSDFFLEFAQLFPRSKTPKNP